MSFKESVAVISQNLINCFKFQQNDQDEVVYDPDEIFGDSDGNTKSNNFSRLSRSSKMSTRGSAMRSNRSTMKGGSGRHSGQNPGHRASVAVIECPLPSLMGSGSATEFGTAGSSTIDLINQVPSSHNVGIGIRPSFNVPITNNVSVNALEISPASPEREKLVEIYVLNEGTIKNALENENCKSSRQTLSHLKKFFEEIERDAIVLMANKNGDLRGFLEFLI